MRTGSKRISTSFTVILILLTLITGCFLLKYFTKGKSKSIPATNIVVFHPHKKHKRKHKTKKYIAVTPTPQSVTVEKNSPTIPVPIKPIEARSSEPVVKPVNTKLVIAAKSLTTKSLIDSIKPNKPHPDFLYATYVQPNATGIVNMRAADNFYSNTIASIPGKSKVFVLQKGNTYYKVSFNNNIGFVPKWALQIK